MCLGADVNGFATEVTEVTALRFQFRFVNGEHVARKVTILEACVPLTRLMKEFLSVCSVAKLLSYWISTQSPVCIALKVAIAGTYVFPIRRQKQIAFIQRSEDRKMIAVMNVVLGTKIDVHNKVFGYCLGTVTGHYGDHLTIFRPLDK